MKKPVKRVTPETLAATGTEHGHQTALFCYIRQEAPHVLPPDVAAKLSRAFAIPNGGLRHKATAGKLKAEGVKAGVPDIFLPVPRIVPALAPLRSMIYLGGMFLEMKKPGSVKATTDGQDEWISYLQEYYETDVCDNWQDAVALLLSYITGQPYFGKDIPRRWY